MYPPRVSGVLSKVSREAGWPFDNVKTVDPVNPNADYPNIPDAVADALVGDIIWVNPGTYALAGRLEITKSVTLAGADAARVTISYGGASDTIHIDADDVTLQDLTVTNASTTNSRAPVITNNDGFLIKRCALAKTGAAFDNIGLYLFGGSGKLIETDISSSGATNANYGILNGTADVALEVILGHIDGPDGDIVTTRSGSTFELNDPVLENDALDVVATTATGWYYDANGNHKEPSIGDTYPAGLGQGVVSRFIDTGLTTSITDHFRSGVIPWGLAWAGAPFATPSSILWSFLNDWLRANFAGVNRAFLFKTGDFRGLNEYARIALVAAVNCGLRFDDGTDNNFCEYRIVNTGGANYVLRISQTTAGVPAANVDTVIPAIPFTYVLRLFCSYSAPNVRPFGYVITEPLGSLFKVAGANANWAAAPAGWRYGVVFDYSAFLYCDWIILP